MKFNRLKTDAVPHDSLLKIIARSPHPWIDCLSLLIPVIPEIFHNENL